MDALIVAFVVYLAAVVIISLVSSRAMTSQSEFLLGGQRLPGWAIAISERASGESAWLLLGLTGAVLSLGRGEFWTVLGIVLGILFLWIYLGRRVREELARTDAITLPEFFAQRLKDPGNLLRWTASLIIVFFFSFYVAAQMVGAGKILQQTGIITDAWAGGFAPEVWGIVLGAVIVIAYTLVGGFRAVVWTDLLQGGIMIVALVLLPIVGWMELREAHVNLGDALVAAGDNRADWFGGKRGFAAFSLVLGGMAWGLGYMGQPHLLVRFMALPDPREVSRLRWLAGSWTVLAYGGAFAIGLVAIALVQGGILPVGDSERIMPLMASTLLPGWIAGIVISGAVAAMMSTADSQLLVVSSAFSEDISRRILGRELGPKKQVALSRLVVFLVGVAAFALGLSSRETVYGMVSYAWSGLGSSFGPAVLLTVTWKGFNRWGAWACMLVGSIGTIVWKNVGALDAWVSHRFAAFALALAAGALVAVLSGRIEARH